MDNAGLKKQVKVWAKKIGHKEAMRRLVNADISVAIAQKLFRGKYESDLSFDKAQAILEELHKDGFPLADGKAS